ncbi:anti-sigma factor [Chitinophaga arvensicola]|uniref:Tetratricopeptide repeat-containing protein n=1 Tax=Chitinophaga arvensicola TaxID=29529 RepID=A0A1I0SDJ5_9BACT|nr:hypothetical protein [Chitinophaga arvensicola]SEW56274.1 hypothetical protein SAMN04488122_6615 [Chitinophaga arvensicola]
MAAYNQEDIIRYVEGDMPPEERLQFEAILREDAALAESVQQYREVTAVLSARLQPDPGLQQLKATLETQRSHFHQKGKVVAFKKYFATIGVAAAVMAGIFLFRFYSRDTNYMANYGNIEMQVAAERGNNEDTLLQSAALYFNEKAYTKVIPLLDTYLSKDSSSQTALYYRGIAATQTGAVEAGMTDLVKVYQGESVFKYDAVFYIALYHAQTGNKKEALIWLKKIPADASAAAKAASLEKDLK